MPTAKKIALALFKALRVMLFYVMFWLRLPVAFISRIIVAPAFLIGLFSLWAMPDLRSMSYGFLLISFTALIALWMWDGVMMWLSPREMATFY